MSVTKNKIRFIDILTEKKIKEKEKHNKVDNTKKYILDEVTKAFEKWLDKDNKNNIKNALSEENEAEYSFEISVTKDNGTTIEEILEKCGGGYSIVEDIGKIFGKLFGDNLSNVDLEEVMDDKENLTAIKVISTYRFDSKKRVFLF